MTRSARAPAAAWLAAALCCAAAAPALGAASVAGKRPPELAQAPTDRSLFQDAQAAAARLEASRKLAAQRAEWEKVVQKYRRVVLNYPRSGYSDDALLAVGNLYRRMAERFKLPRHRDEAVAAYRMLAQEYPSSKLGDAALFAAFQIVSETGDRKKSADAGRAYLEAFPDGANAAAVKAALKRRTSASVPEPALPSPPPPGLAQVFALRSWSGDSSTRVVIDVEKQLPIKYDRLRSPDRLFVDLQGARLHPNLKDRSFPVGDGMLEQVRIAQNQDRVVRVVLDFKSAQDHQVFYLQDPPRLVIDVRGEKPEAAATASLRRPAASPAPATVAAVVEESLRVEDRQPVPEDPAPAASAEEPPQLAPSRPVTGLAAAPPAPPAPALSPRRPPPAIVLEGTGPAPAARAAKAPAVPAPTPPAANRTGQYSLARQLGLSARRIVIDAGHGGHDPGTIGRAGLQEKDLVLDVALRLEKLIREQLGADVLLTRQSDVFIPLEERTAIANAKGADLFLSIHANSSRNAGARGIETYYLNFARNPHAESVAARENAISQATLKDLQTLVKAIALNSKIDESREFATEVQEALVQNLKGLDPAMPDRGVHTAPFYVLIGANMPSILAEIAFVSHPGEERLLKRGEYRDRIAHSLLEGVRGYLASLNRGPTRALTAADDRPTVGAKGQSR